MVCGFHWKIPAECWNSLELNVFLMYWQILCGIYLRTDAFPETTGRGQMGLKLRKISIEEWI